MDQRFRRKVVVVDDEPIIRTLVADKLSSLGFEAWPAPDALAGKQLVNKYDPDGLIVDLDLGPGPNGIELITMLNAINPGLGFVLLTNFVPAAWELKVAKNIRFVKKSDVLEFSLLVEALEQVLTGRIQSATSDESQTIKLIKSLTKKQLRVLSLVAEGKTNQEIADEQSVSLGAVEQTMKRIYAALHLEDRARANRRIAASRLYTEVIGPRRAS